MLSKLRPAGPIPERRFRSSPSALNLEKGVTYLAGTVRERHLGKIPGASRGANLGRGA